MRQGRNKHTVLEVEKKKKRFSYPKKVKAITCLIDLAAIFSVLAGSICSKPMSSAILFISWVKLANLLGLLTSI